MNKNVHKLPKTQIRLSLINLWKHKFNSNLINMFKFASLIALSAASLCFVDNCEQCSSSSPYICLGCKTSYNLTSSGCLYSEGYVNEYPPNCRVFKENKSCLKCEEEYHEINGFCQADCYDDCVCFKPYDCIPADIEDYKKTDENKCIKGCSVCNNTETCTKCKKGYYKNKKNHCSKCMKDCKTCSSSDYCDTCKSNRQPRSVCPTKRAEKTKIVIYYSLLVIFSVP